MRINDLTPKARPDELASIVAMIRSATIPVDQIGSVVDYVGSAVDAVQAIEGDRLSLLGLPPLIGAVTDDAVEKAFEDVREWLSAPYDIRTVLDATFPRNLHSVFNKPPLLFCRGAWIEERDSRAVAVVGTRSASDEGLRRAGQLSRDLAAAGFTVVSGLARGIDTAAHVAALQYGGRTVAVMGTGIDLIYPNENLVLSEQILNAGGALLSQFFPRQPPTQWTFPKRNVVMSGLSLATVVVEASVTSGARMQARVALQHGRTVFLLKSLVEEHKWARQYVEEGVYGTTALMISSSDDLIDRLELRKPEPELVTA
jgi:DNA processing protein